MLKPLIMPGKPHASWDNPRLWSTTDFSPIAACFSFPWNQPSVLLGSASMLHQESQASLECCDHLCAKKQHSWWHLLLASSNIFLLMLYNRTPCENWDTPRCCLSHLMALHNISSSVHTKFIKGLNLVHSCKMRTSNIHLYKLSCSWCVNHMSLNPKHPINFLSTKLRILLLSSGRTPHMWAWSLSFTSQRREVILSKHIKNHLAHNIIKNRLLGWCLN